MSKLPIGAVRTLVYEGADRERLELKISDGMDARFPTVASFAPAVDELGLTEPLRWRGDDHSTALHVAAERQNLRAFVYLATIGDLDLTMPNAAGDTPVHIACRLNEVDMVDFALTSLEGAPTAPHALRHLFQVQPNIMSAACRSRASDVVVLLFARAGALAREARVDYVHDVCLGGFEPTLRVLIDKEHYAVTAAHMTAACSRAHAPIVWALYNRYHAPIEWFDALLAAARAHAPALFVELLALPHANAAARDADGRTLESALRECGRGEFVAHLRTSPASRAQRLAQLGRRRSIAHAAARPVLPPQPARLRSLVRSSSASASASSPTQTSSSSTGADSDSDDRVDL